MSAGAAAGGSRLLRALQALETALFRRRAIVLALLALLTLVMGFFALQLRMDAGFEKQMPIGHEYIGTFKQYRDDLLGANRLTVVVRARSGTIWSKPGLTRLYEVTQAVMFLPYVSRGSVQSLWTPNSFVNEITEEGFRADPIIPGTVTPERLDAAAIAAIARTTQLGGYVGTLVARDQGSAMISAELNEYDAKGVHIDYIAYNHVLEQQLRERFEDAGFEIQIIGFAKQIGDIADGASAVLEFCLLALLLTAAAVYWYCHSLRFTLLAIGCSLTSLVWQFGTLRLMGYGLDPLAVLVPFLVFAIGVSHGVQQINFIVRRISHGRSTFDACRDSFSGLLIPGALALVTAFVSFITLLLIPIPMVRELAVTASLGVAYKIVTNLVMLPLAASSFRFDARYAERAVIKRDQRAHWLRALARLAEPRHALVVLGVTAAVFATAAWQSRDRVIGTLQPGAPELRADARFNRDAVAIAGHYDTGLDWLTVVFEAAPESCENVAIGVAQDRFAWAMQAVPGVLSIASFAGQMRQYNEGYNEGNPKMAVVPIDPANYAGLATEISRVPGTMRKDCSMTAVHLYLTDHKATTINGVIAAVKAYRTAHPQPGVTIRLAAGNAGVLAAIDEEVEHSELPMLLYVYAAIAALVLLVYRDLRAVLACCLPLTIGTFVGYWFMKELQIGLTVATLPVMVLSVGIGVDYAFYIYNRLQLHLANGQDIVKALEHSILEVGTATIFTAITLAIGVATWSFSALKFQADMGKLLAFMFMVNMVMAMTVLPAFAVWLEKLFPRRRPVHAPGLLQHGDEPALHAVPPLACAALLLALLLPLLAAPALAQGQTPATPAPPAPPAPLVPVAAQRVAHASQAMLLAAARAGERIVAVGNHGVVLLSDDNGRSFRQARAVPIDSTLTGVSFADARNGWAVGHWGAILHSTDGGETWTLQRSDVATDRPLFAVHFFDPRRGVAVGLWSLVLATDDGGAHWQAVQLAPPEGAKKADLNLYGLFADAQAHLYATAERGMLLRSDDHGRRWSYQSTGYKGSLWAGTAATDGSLYAAGLRGSLYRSDDGGSNWRALASGSTASISAMAAVGRDVVAVGADGLLLRRRDGAASFEPNPRADRLSLTAVIAAADGRTVLFSRLGVVADAKP